MGSWFDPNLGTAKEEGLLYEGEDDEREQCSRHKERQDGEEHASGQGASSREHSHQRAAECKRTAKRIQSLVQEQRKHHTQQVAGSKTMIVRTPAPRVKKNADTIKSLLQQRRQR